MPRLDFIVQITLYFAENNGNTLCGVYTLKEVVIARKNKSLLFLREVYWGKNTQFKSFKAKIYIKK